MSAESLRLLTCEQCGELYGGSHYHCSCGTLDVTGMYGHHSTFCKITRRQEEFHHCGPSGDCSLAPAGSWAAS